MESGKKIIGIEEKGRFRRRSGGKRLRKN